ncbi:MAG: hypothetical protein NC418_11845 [Muribaculaceae bacterium]|nr:hypothetical protein [Muribaculaceae bacterium]
MNKLLAWLRESNRWKHLVGGFAVGVLAAGAYSALYAATVAASCLEFKDRAHGCRWDWIDWALTVAGGAVAAAAWGAITHIS